MLSIVIADGFTTPANVTAVVPAAESVNTASSPSAKVVSVVGGISQLAVPPTFHSPFGTPDACPFQNRPLIAETSRSIVLLADVTMLAVMPGMGVPSE